MSAHEVRTDGERLSESVGDRLLGIFEFYPPLPAGSEKTLECRVRLGCADDQDVADARKHEDRQRVVDHRLVVNRQQLF